MNNESTGQMQPTAASSEGPCQAWYILVILLAAWVGLYIICELHYFIRVILCIITAKFFKSRLHVLDQASAQGICILNDVDVLLTHMNNARYVRELDFARVDFYERTALFAAIRRRGGGIVQGACTIRYRKPLQTFSRYIVTTKIVWWDEVSLYMEHRFLRHSDMFVLSVATCRQRVTGGVNVCEVMCEMLGRQTNGTTTMGPPSSPPRDLALWIESNALSSAAIRGETQLTQIESNGGGIQMNPKMDHPHLTNVMPAANSIVPMVQVS